MEFEIDGINICLKWEILWFFGLVSMLFWSTVSLVHRSSSCLENLVEIFCGNSEFYLDTTLRISVGNRSSISMHCPHKAIIRPKQKSFLFFSGSFSIQRKPANVNTCYLFSCTQPVLMLSVATILCTIFVPYPTIPYYTERRKWTIYNKFAFACVS